MARDFIYIDSDKVKQTLKDVLEMGEGDLSGNKLGLSSKVVPVVSLNKCPGSFTRVNYSVAAVQNTWYQACSLDNVRIWDFSIAMYTLAEDVEARVVIDDYTNDQAQAAAVADTPYHGYMDAFYQFNLIIDNVMEYKSMFGDIRHFEFWIRKTSANAANLLGGLVIYQQW